MADRSSSPTDNEVKLLISNLQNQTYYYLRERRLINYAESCVSTSFPNTKRRRQRCRSIDGTSRRRNLNKRCASVPPSDARNRTLTQSIYDQGENEENQEKTFQKIPPQSMKKTEKVGRKGRKKSTDNRSPNSFNEPQLTYNNSESTCREVEEEKKSPDKTKNLHCNGSKNHPKGKGTKGRRNSTGSEHHQETKHQDPPSESWNGKKGEHSPRKIRRKSTGDKSRQESSRTYVKDLKEREIQYTICEKRLEAMYREDDTNKVAPKEAKNDKQIKVFIPLDKIFVGTLNDTEELMEILSKGDDDQMVHFKKKLIQRSAPADQHSIKEVPAQQSTEEAAQSNSSTLKNGDAPTSTKATSVSPPSGPESEKRQAVKRHITSSTSVPLDYSLSSESKKPRDPPQRHSYPVTDSDPSSVPRPSGNSAKHQKHPKTDKTSSSDPRQQDDDSGSEQKQLSGPGQRSSNAGMNSDPGPVRRARSNSANHQKEPKKDKTPRVEPRQQDGDQRNAGSEPKQLTELEKRISDPDMNSDPTPVLRGRSNTANHQKQPKADKTTLRVDPRQQDDDQRNAGSEPKQLTRLGKRISDPDVNSDPAPVRRARSNSANRQKQPKTDKTSRVDPRQQDENHRNAGSEPKQLTGLEKRISDPDMNSDPGPVRRARSNSANHQKQPKTDKTPIVDPRQQDANHRNASGSEPKQLAGLEKRISDLDMNSDPGRVGRARSNSANHQNQPKTDKAPRVDPRHQDDSSAAQRDFRNMNCTITRLETPGSIPVNIKIGATNDLETIKTLLILVDSIMRNDDLSVENLMALNKFYRDLKNYNNPDEGLKRDIEDRTKQLVRFIAKHLVGAQCNLSYIERILSIDLQPHEQFFRRYIRKIKHYARDQQSMETLIKNLSSSKEIVLPPISAEVPVKVVRFDLQEQPNTIHSPLRVDPRFPVRPPALRYNLPFSERPNNFRMMNPAQMQNYNHQVQSSVYLNRPMFTVSPPTYSPIRNNNQNWSSPVQMMRPTNYTISRMLIPLNSGNNAPFMRSIFDTPPTRPAVVPATVSPNITELRDSNGAPPHPRFPSPNSIGNPSGRFKATPPYDVNINNSTYPRTLPSVSSRPVMLPVTASPNITELRDSNGTFSPRFPSPNTESNGRFKAASYDLNMNNSPYSNSFNTLDLRNKAAVTVLNDPRNMVGTTQTPVLKNVSNPDGTPPRHFIQSNPRNIARLISPVNNTDTNNSTPTVSNSFAHKNQNNESRFIPSSNTERNNSYVHSNLRSNRIDLENVVCGEKSPLDSKTEIKQNGKNSFNKSNTTLNEALVRNPSTSGNEMDINAVSFSENEQDQKPTLVINHPIVVVDKTMSVILTRNSIKGGVEDLTNNNTLTKSESVKSEDEDSKDTKQTTEWYYAQQLKRWKKIVKDSDPKKYQHYQQLFLETSETDSSVIIVDDNDEEDNDVCCAEYSNGRFNNNMRMKEHLPDEIPTIEIRKLSASSKTPNSAEITRDDFHSRGLAETNNKLVSSANFQVHSNGAIEKAGQSSSYYAQRTSSGEDASSSFQRGQIVKGNLQQMLRLSNADESTRVELQTSNIRGEIANGYSQFQPSGNSVGNSRDILPFQLERASDSTGGIQGMDWRVWMSHEGERRISNIHETPTVAPRNYSGYDKWFQIGYTDTTVSKTESIIKMVQCKLVYDEMNHSLVNLIEDAHGNEKRIEISLPRNVFLSREDFLSDPELYIKEYGIVANHAPFGYLQYYRYVTGFQIVRNKPPVSFLTFLQLNNAGQLRELFKKFLNSLEKNGDENSFSPL